MSFHFTTLNSEHIRILDHEGITSSSLSTRRPDGTISHRLAVCFSERLTLVLMNELNRVTMDQKKMPQLRMTFLLKRSPRKPKMGAATMKLQMKTVEEERKEVTMVTESRGRIKNQQ